MAYNENLRMDGGKAQCAARDKHGNRCRLMADIHKHDFRDVNELVRPDEIAAKLEASGRTEGP